MDSKVDESIKNKDDEKEENQDENHKETAQIAKSRRMRNSLITEFLKPIDTNENKIQAEHLKRIGELETHCRRLEKEETLLLKELDNIQSVHKKPLNQIKKNKSGHQKKRKQENSNQLPAKQESRGEAFKSVPAEKGGRSSEEKEQEKQKQQQQ